MENRTKTNIKNKVINNYNKNIQAPSIINNP